VAGLTLMLGLIYLQAGFLTYSRSSFATILLSSLIVVMALWSRRALPQQKRAYPWMGLAGVVLVFTAVNAWASPIFRLRLSTESDEQWYRAAIEAPQQLELSADSVTNVTLEIQNQGAFTWSSTGRYPIHLAAQWRRSDEVLLPEEPRWPLTRDVAPGEALTLTVPVQAPSTPDDYGLEWDMVQENVTWFSAKSGTRVKSQVTVIPVASQGVNQEDHSRVDTLMGAVPLVSAPIPGRRTLWQIAWQQFVAHPVLGIGPDNFRLTYGRFLGWTTWNETIHTNNWYLETLVSLGLFGSLPYFIWMVFLAADIVRTMRPPTSTFWHAALAVGLLAYLIHGLLDYFLLSNETGLPFWLLVGLWAAQRNFTGHEL
jgi:hypothetical protein